MRRPNNRLPADITAVFGSTGTRKTTGYVMPRVDAERGAVVIWDAKNEYQGVPGVVTVYDRAELVQAVRSCRRLAFHAPPDEFAFWCRVVWARGDALVIAEELAQVTTPGKACGAWHQILTAGRGFGLRTIGIGQRPAEVDKTIIGQASLLHVRRLTRAADRRYMAAELDVAPGIVDAMRGDQWIEREIATGAVRVGAGIRKPGRAQGRALKVVA